MQATIRRTAYVESKGLLYIGTGVSGGEEGEVVVDKILDTAGQICIFV